VKTGIIITLAFLNLMCLCTNGISLCHANDLLIVDASVDKNTITIGDPIEYTITIKRDEKTKTEPLVFGENLGAFEIRNLKMGKEKKYGLKFRDHGWYLMSQIKLTLTIFDVGSFTIPSIRVKHIDEAGKQGEISTKEITITVESLVPVDAKDIRGFKGPAELISPFSTTLFRVGFCGSIFIAASATGVFIYLRRKKRRTIVVKDSVIEEDISKPLHLIALEELDRVNRLNLLRNGCVEEFYILISETIRHYIESRYNIDTIQKNTEEILEEIKSIPLEDNIPETIEDFLKECDLVKFARLAPQKNKSQEALEKARKIVKITCSPQS
jgi:hypothetical protein